MAEVQALCDFCEKPLAHGEAVELWRYVYHPHCKEEVERRLAQAWDWIMSVDMSDADCTTCFHLPIAPEGWHCASHRDAPVDCGDWKGAE